MFYSDESFQKIFSGREAPTLTADNWLRINVFVVRCKNNALSMRTIDHSQFEHGSSFSRAVGRRG